MGNRSCSATAAAAAHQAQPHTACPRTRPAGGECGRNAGGKRCSDPRDCCSIYVSIGVRPGAGLCSLSSTCSKQQLLSWLPAGTGHQLSKVPAGGCLPSKIQLRSRSSPLLLPALCQSTLCLPTSCCYRAGAAGGAASAQSASAKVAPAGDSRQPSPQPSRRAGAAASAASLWLREVLPGWPAGRDKSSPPSFLLCTARVARSASLRRA